MSCTTVLTVAQFSPNTVEVEANGVKFGPTGTEGSVVMFSNIEGLDTFYLQASTDEIETEISQFWDYTDGYAVELKYEFAIGSTDGTYGACLTSQTKAQQSCWTVTIDATNVEITGTASYYETSNIANNYNLLSTGVPITETCAWNAGFNKLWSIAHTKDASNYHVTAYRFLPKLSNDVSPTGDFRFAPISDKNPDQASDTAVWVYNSPTSWAEYSVTLAGATEVIIGAASAAVVALLTF